MQETILLGAGASVEAGIPVADELTEKILDGFPVSSDEARLLFFVMGGLLFQKATKGQNPKKSPINFESLLNALQLLSERDEMEIAPFVSSWNPTIEELESRLSSRPNSDYFRLHRVLSRKALNGGEIADAIKDLLETNSSKPKTRSLYLALKNKIIQNLKNILWIEDSKKVEHLFPLLRLFERQKGLTVTTLNYDNCIELLLESKGVECNTQMENWTNNKNLEFSEGQFNLIKLHGSINWAKSSQKGRVEHPIQFDGIEELDPTTEEVKNYSPQIIFGTTNKLTTDGPYLDLLREFRKNLFNSKGLTVVGYSFRDAHVNHYISQWINFDKDNRLRVIDKSEYLLGLDFFREWSSKLSTQITFIPKSAGQGLGELFGDV